MRLNNLSSELDKQILLYDALSQLSALYSVGLTHEEQTQYGRQLGELAEASLRCLEKVADWRWQPKAEEMLLVKQFEQFNQRLKALQALINSWTDEKDLVLALRCCEWKWTRLLGKILARSGSADELLARLKIESENRWRSLKQMYEQILVSERDMLDRYEEASETVA